MHLRLQISFSDLKTLGLYGLLKHLHTYIYLFLFITIRFVMFYVDFIIGMRCFTLVIQVTAYTVSILP